VAIWQAGDARAAAVQARTEAAMAKAVQGFIVTDCLNEVFPAT
jgi:hypothetical protein